MEETELQGQSSQDGVQGEREEREGSKGSEKGSSFGSGGFGRAGDQQQEAEEEGDGNGWLARGGFLKTHPATEERYRRIVEELKSWEVNGDRK